MQRHIFLPQLQSAHDLIRLPIEELRHGAAAGALHALITQKDILPGFVLHTSRKFRIDWRCFVHMRLPIAFTQGG
jgi:hypothetical protein